MAHLDIDNWLGFCHYYLAEYKQQPKQEKKDQVACECSQLVLNRNDQEINHDKQ